MTRLETELIYEATCRTCAFRMSARSFDTVAACLVDHVTAAHPDGGAAHDGLHVTARRIGTVPDPAPIVTFPPEE